jgi:hypothetical protein
MGRKRHFLIGVASGATAFVVSMLVFGATLTRCRAETQSHHPALCSPSDRHPNILFLGMLALSLVIAASGLTRLQTKAIRLVAGILAATYAAYGVLVWTT